MTIKVWKSVHHVPQVNKLTWVNRVVQAFHEDEDGMETIEKILALFVAAIILIALIAFFNNGVFDNVKNKIKEFFSQKAN